MVNEALWAVLRDLASHHGAEDIAIEEERRHRKLISALAVERNLLSSAAYAIREAYDPLMEMLGEENTVPADLRARLLDLATRMKGAYIIDLQGKEYTRGATAHERLVDLERKVADLEWEREKDARTLDSVPAGGDSE